MKYPGGIPGRCRPGYTCRLRAATHVTVVCASHAAGDVRQSNAERRTETAGSDVDVLIVGTASFGAVVAFHPAQGRIGRDTNPKVFAEKEWQAKAKGKNGFVTEVLKSQKTLLMGVEHDRAEVGRYRPLSQ